MELSEDPTDFTLYLNRLVQLLMMLNKVIPEDQLLVAMVSRLLDQYDMQRQSVDCERHLTRARIKTLIV